MDRNIDFNHLIENFSKIRENNTFFNDMLSLNDSNQFDKTEETIECTQNSVQCLNITTSSDLQEVNNSFFSFQLLSDNEMVTKLTPSLEMKTNVSKSRKLFGFHNKKQLFVNNFCVNNESKENINTSLKPIEVKDKVEDKVEDNKYFDNTLGLSPVKKHLNSSISKSSLSLSNFEKNSLNGLEDMNDIQINSFSPNGKQMETESLLAEESFKSLSKCSDLDLKPEEPKVDINQTYRPPNSGFGDKSITSYFQQFSEPIGSNKSTNESINYKTFTQTSGNVCRESLFNESFGSVSGEIDSSNNTLENFQKIIDRKNRKRKTNSIFSTNLSETVESNNCFTPSISSTLNSCDDFSDESKQKSSPESNQSPSVVTSGLGTLSAMTVQTFSMPHSCLQPFNSMNANLLNLNQFLKVSPNVLSLTIGCFVDFKLNYLKIRNLTINPFKVELKIQANVDTLNALQIEYPKQMINIPPLFDGLLSDQITITPLKLGSFSLVFQIYVSTENMNLPLSPMSVVCHIRSEEITIKRLFHSSDSLEIKYNLFEGELENQTIDLCVSNRKVVNEIPLKLCLESNRDIVFMPIFRHENSAIHTFRCSNPYQMFLVTQTQYEMRIPIRIQSKDSKQTESCLTLSTDSQKSNILGIFRLTATFWPKKKMTEPLLQCSDHSLINLKTNIWEEIYFRNKSKDHLIRVKLECVRNKVKQNCIKVSTTQLMIPPLTKMSAALMANQKAAFDSDSLFQLSIIMDSGLGKGFSYFIPIKINSI